LLTLLGVKVWPGWERAGVELRPGAMQMFLDLSSLGAKFITLNVVDRAALEKLHGGQLMVVLTTASARRCRGGALTGPVPHILDVGRVRTVELGRADVPDVAVPAAQHYA